MVYASTAHDFSGERTDQLQNLMEDIAQRLSSRRQREKAGRALLESEQRLRSIIDHSVELFYLHDTEHKLIYVSPQCFNIFGYRPEEMVVKWTTLTTDAPMNQKGLELTERAIKTGRKQEPYLLEIRRKDGDLRIIEIDESPVKDENGAVIAISGALRDVTERKKAENELCEYQAKLKAMALEILHTQERERQRLAVGLHDDICQKLVFSKFTLESSLCSISDAEVTSSFRRVAETISETIRMAESLTFELSNPILREFGFVSALEKYLSTEIKDKHGIDFELDVTEPLGTLQEDIKTCLFRVACELLTNVVKHAKAQKVKVSVRKKHDVLYLTIQDDGVGFDPAKLTGRDSRAVRFGLFSIREQLEHLGGILTIESSPGRGTMVMVII
jgi:two-component system sensor histidine kinase UhpB